MRRATSRNTRCVDGRVMRHDPQHDDPHLETDIGQCEECEGEGCMICERCGCNLNGEAAHIESSDEIWCHPCVSLLDQQAAAECEEIAFKSANKR